MLLQRGHGITLSGFFSVVFSCDWAGSLCSLFDFAVSSSMEGVSGFTTAPGEVLEFLVSSSFAGGRSASCSFSLPFSDPES